MVTVAKEGGLDWASRPNLDVVGIVYLLTLGLATIPVVIGSVLLFRYRRLPFIRMRNVSLVLSSLAVLHVCLCMFLLLYPLNGRMPCQTEYWSMIICLSVGVALFQAQNMQLLSLSSQQRSLLHHSGWFQRRSGRWWRFKITKPRQSWANLNLLQRTYFCVAVGIVVLYIMAYVLFFTSRTFHRWGVWGKIPDFRSNCRRSAEWIPAILWQCIWAYGCGPLLLYRVARIKDVHHWRVQTTLCILAGLPGAPLWIAAQYGDAFVNVNKYWPPPMWFVPGLLVMEFLTLYIPLLEVYQMKKSWRRRSAPKGSQVIIASNNGPPTEVSPQVVRNLDLYSMAALEQAIEEGSQALLTFAATEDFTGENVIFLIRVRDWKARWRQLSHDDGRGGLSVESRRQLYEDGVDIFVHCISVHTSPFPINIEGLIYSELENIFAPREVTSHSSPNTLDMISPFLNPQSQSNTNQHHRSWPSPSRHGGGDDQAVPLPVRNATTTTAQNVQVPDGFGQQVFDQAESAVKHMVLANTWVRFVDRGGGSTISLSSCAESPPLLDTSSSIPPPPPLTFSSSSLSAVPPQPTLMSSLNSNNTVV